MLVAIQVFGGLGLFLFGMMVMSEGLQKVAGDKLRQTIRSLTSNRFAGIFTGFAVTSIIQSSSATTVMLVSFVNAGLITLQQSVGVIMGANIGTTVTGWLVAIFGFKVNISLIALIAVGFGFFLRITGKKRLPYWGEVLLGFGLIFIGLDFMKDATSGLKQSVMIMDWMSRFSTDSFLSLIMVILTGALVTMIIQSSSATMALTMTLAAQGIIDFPTAAALILGENVGTTITANIAALGASINAKRTALAHFFFNVLGLFWVILSFGYFIRLVDSIVPGNPAMATSIPNHMAAFHTLFNITNTVLFLPFVASLARLVKTLLPQKQKEETRLTYIDSGLVATPSLALESARMVLYIMAKSVRTMMYHVNDILRMPGMELNYHAEQIEKIEESTDSQKEVITTFLRNVMKHSTSEHSGTEVTRILSHVNDLERIGDHGRNIKRLVMKVVEEEIPLPLEAHQDLMEIADTTIQFITLVQNGLKKPGKDIMNAAREFEKTINTLRNRGREHHHMRLIQNTCDIASGLVFLDIIVHFEKIGDHAYNIAQRVSGIR